MQWVEYTLFHWSDTFLPSICFTSAAPYFTSSILSENCKQSVKLTRVTYFILSLSTCHLVLTKHPSFILIKMRRRILWTVCIIHFRLLFWSNFFENNFARDFAHMQKFTIIRLEVGFQLFNGRRRNFWKLFIVEL